MGSKQEVLDQVGGDLKLYLAIVGTAIFQSFVYDFLGAHSVVRSYVFFLGFANVRLVR